MRAGKKPAHYEKDIREAVRHLDGLDGKKGTRTVTAWEKLQKARIMEWCARHPSGEEVVDIVEDELKSAKAKVSFWDLAKTATKEKGKGGKKLTDFGGVVNTLGKTARRKKLKLLLKTARENVQLATAKVDAELKEMRAKVFL
jgi:pyruvate dehydrogenase complex dehydrogenase (E1) component